MIALFWSLAVVGFRLYLVIPFLMRSPLSLVFGVSELISLAGTVVVLRLGRRDLSATGLLLPMLHLPCLLFLPDDRAPGLAAGFFLVFAFGCCVLRLWMGIRCTVGVPVFYSLLSRGPYALVRHPLSACELLTHISFAVCFWSVRNAAVLGAVVFCGAACVAIEERFLKCCAPAYLVYCGRVRWRWCPGVW